MVADVTGSKKATTAMVTMLFVISFNCNLASIASVSRLTWAWARDGGMPSYFAYVSISEANIKSTKVGLGLGY